MATQFDFPANPAVDDLHGMPDGVTVMRFDGTAWWPDATAEYPPTSFLLADLRFGGADGSTDVVNSAPGGIPFQILGEASIQASAGLSGSGLSIDAAPGQYGGAFSVDPVTVPGPFCMQGYFRPSVYGYGMFFALGGYYTDSFITFEHTEAGVDSYRESSAENGGLLGEAGTPLAPSVHSHVMICRDEENMVRATLNGELVLGPVLYEGPIVGKIGLGSSDPDSTFTAVGAALDSFQFTLGSPVYTSFPFEPPAP